MVDWGGKCQRHARNQARSRARTGAAAMARRRRDRAAGPPGRAADRRQRDPGGPDRRAGGVRQVDRLDEWGGRRPATVRPADARRTPRRSGAADRLDRGRVAELAPIDEQVFAALLRSPAGDLEGARSRACSNRCDDADDAIVLALDDVHRAPRRVARVVASLARRTAGRVAAGAGRRAPSPRSGSAGCVQTASSPSSGPRSGDDRRMRRICCCAPCGLELQPESVGFWSSTRRAGRRRSTSRPCRCAMPKTPTEAAREFAGDDRIVADYLRDEFVARLSSEDARLPDPHLDHRRALTATCATRCSAPGLGEMLQQLRPGQRARQRGRREASGPSVTTRCCARCSSPSCTASYSARGVRASRARQQVVRAARRFRSRRAARDRDRRARPRRRPDLVTGRRLRERRTRGDAAALAEVVLGTGDRRLGDHSAW